MKKPQWITAGAALLILFLLYYFGTTVPPKPVSPDNTAAAQAEGHEITIDSILYYARQGLNPDQAARVEAMEHEVVRGDVRQQQLEVYHKLSHFWRDSARIFEPYAWYEAEGARLENSEKNLTFAARLFLDNLQQESEPALKRWKALQAKDLFERSLKLNPGNDSAMVGLGACYLFGGIAAMPMEGISIIRKVLDRDSTNAYALMTLAEASLMTGQYDNAIARLQTVHRAQPGDLRTVLMLADSYERKGDKKQALQWYRQSLDLISSPDLKTEVEKRINTLTQQQ